MFRKLLQNPKLTQTLVMGLFSILCFGLWLFRHTYTDTKLFIFLNWNLFLAFVPWALTTSVLILKLQKNKLVILCLLASWLLFFPNAPYILTDLFHLKVRKGIPIWFDLILILSFAWTGLLFGFLSLWDIEKILRPSLKPSWISFISIILLFLTSFGIYLGRFLRWNSWDIIQKPFVLFYDITERFMNPIEHPRTWGMTILMGFLLNMMYWSFKMIRKTA